MTADLAARVLRVVQNAVRTARSAEDQAEAKAVLDELTAEPPIESAVAPAPEQTPHDAARVQAQAQNAAAEQAAYARANGGT